MADLLDQGRQSFGRQAWADAFAQLSAADRETRLAPEDLERLVAERAEGNPFFIEELLQALQELGSLAVADGTVVLAKVDVEIPDTVQGTVLARVDRLDPRARAVLQHAAVLGRSFPADLLEAVAGNGE